MTITTTMIKELRGLTGAGILECKQVLQANDGDFEKAANYLRQQGLEVVAEKSERATNEGLVVLKTARDVVCAVAVTCETDFVARTPDFKTFTHRLADQILVDANLTDVAQVLSADFVDTPGKTVTQVIQELIRKMDENILVAHVARYRADDTGLVEGYIHVGEVEGYGPMEGRVGVLVELRVDDAAACTAPILRELAHDLALQIAALQPVYVTRTDIPEEVLAEKRAELLAQAVAAQKPEAIIAKILEGQLAKFYREVCLLEQPFIREEGLTIADLLHEKSQELGTPVTIARFARLAVGI
jgi:elongation factor Ts